MAAAQAEDFTAALETVEQRTRAAIDALRGLEAIALSNDPDNEAIPQCLEAVVDSFEQIRACEASIGGVQVPRDVVESVDQGRNPDAFLAELAEHFLDPLVEVLDAVALLLHALLLRIVSQPHGDL